MYILKLIALFISTAIAEIAGCYLPYLWLKKDGPMWLLLPGAFSLTIFVWLLSLHPTEAGRVYAAYGGIYVSIAILWLWIIDSVRPTRWDLVGATLSVAGMLIIMLGARQS